MESTAHQVYSCGCNVQDHVGIGVSYQSKLRGRVTLNLSRNRKQLIPPSCAQPLLVLTNVSSDLVTHCLEPGSWQAFRPNKELEDLTMNTSNTILSKRTQKRKMKMVGNKIGIKKILHVVLSWHTKGSLLLCLTKQERAMEEARKWGFCDPLYERYAVLACTRNPSSNSDIKELRCGFLGSPSGNEVSIT